MKTFTAKQAIIAAAIAAALIVALSALLIRNNSQMQEMTEVFTEEKTNLIEQYQDLFLDYDSLNSDNDSLNKQLDIERERVAQLQDELKTIKATNARRIKELQGELTTMRTVLRSFVTQIDSLNQKNQALTKENQHMREQVAAVSGQNASLREQNQTLTQQVNIASRLEASAVVVSALNHKDKKTTNIRNATKIKTAFTLLKNTTAKVGFKTIYVRITRPDGQLLMHNANDKFHYEDSDINYSAKRDIEYGGQDTNASVIYTVDAGELMQGAYDIEIFCEGELIGNGSMKL